MFLIKNKNKGQSVIEVLIAITVFAIFVSAMASAVIDSSVATKQGELETVAYSVLQEGFEAVRAIKDYAYNNLYYDESGVEISAGLWQFKGEGTTDAIGLYSRTIVIDEVYRDAMGEIVDASDPSAILDIQTQKVTVTVTWPSYFGVNRQIQDVVYLTNWNSRDWEQTDWSGGTGQNIWSDQTKYSLDDGNIDNTATGEVKLLTGGEATACEGYTWDFETSGDYNFDSGKVEVVGGFGQLKPLAGSNWWDLDYDYRQQITINNNDTSDLPAGYSVSINLDHYSLVQASKSLANGDDIRLVYDNGSSLIEIDRVNKTVWDTNGINAELWFALTNDIPASSSSSDYYLYYGNSSAGAPPAEPNNVFLFFDDFEAGNLNSWTDQIPDWLNPLIRAQINLGDYANDVFVLDDKAYLVTESNGGSELFIYDVSDPLSSNLLGSLNLGTAANAIFVVGNYAYIATDSNSQELILVDVSNPASLSIDETYDSDG